MKGKNIKATLLIAVIILSTLAIAISVNALPGDYFEYGDASTTTTVPAVAEWTTDQSKFGDRSAHLLATDWDGPNDNDYARVVIPVNIDFDDITSLSYWFNYSSPATYFAFPYLIFYIDTDGGTPSTDEIVVMLSGGEDYKPLEDTWIQWDLETATTKALGNWFFNPVGTGAPASTLEDMQLALDGTVLEVKVAVGENAPEHVPAEAWVDDIEINGFTYPLEPILLDAEFYKAGDTVIVTVADAHENDLMSIDEVNVEAHSITDILGDDEIILTETGVNTGIFTGSFTILGEPPADREADEIVVSKDDTITVEYEGIRETAYVDEIAPSVTDLFPADGALIGNTTWVKAKASDENFELAWMTVDGAIRGSSSTSGVSMEFYFGTYNALDAGLHTAEVHAEDEAGNVNITTWSFTVDVVVPTCEISMNVTSPVKAGNIEIYAEFSEGMQDTIITTGNNVTELTFTSEKWTANMTYTINATIAGNYNGTALIDVEGAFDISGKEMVPASFTFYIDTVYPTAPENLTAASGPTSVILDWDASVDVGSGMALYNIYNGTDLVGTVDYPTATFTHTGLNDATSLRYRVGAVDLAGNEENSTVLEVEFTPGAITEWEISLEEGWNLVSLPLIPDDSSVEVVLADILVDVESVWSYDEATGFWSSYAPGAPSDLTDMVDGDGYWVRLSSAATLTVHGDEMPEPPAMPPTYDLFVGWNLIGFKSLVPMRADVYLGESLAEDCIRIYGFDNGVYFGVAMAEVLEPGLGYWIAMSDSGTIYP